MLLERLPFDGIELTTNLTNERLDINMAVEMGVETLFISIHFITQRALIWLESRVSTVVTYVTRVMRESLTTDL